MAKWLKCKIQNGMFSDEVTIVFRTLSGENIAVFVPKDSAQGQASNGRVKVRVDETSGRTIAIFPDANQSVIDIDSAELVAA